MSRGFSSRRLTEVDKTGADSPPARNTSSSIDRRNIVMSAKILYAATLAVALASSLAVAGENAPLTRAQVVADYQHAAAAGTLRKNDYDADTQDFKGVSTQTRAEVIAALRGNRIDPALVGPMRNRTYNPAGVEALRVSTLPRAQVKAEVAAAMRDGSLRRSDYDEDVVHAARRAPVRSTAPVLAGTAARTTSGS
jgi:hypothetical protein